jgi:hypothetical protein
VLDVIIGNRVAPEVELGGLDIPEVGMLGYNDFAIIKGKREEATNGA